MKINRSFLVGFVVWLLAVGSLVVIPIVKRQSCTTCQKVSEENRKILSSITDEQRKAIMERRCGFVKMNDGRFYLVGEECEATEIDLASRGMIVHLLIDNSVVEKIDWEQVRKDREYIEIRNSLPENLGQLLKERKAVILKAPSGEYYMVADKNYID